MADHTAKTAETLNWPDTLGSLIIALIGFVVFPIIISDSIRDIRLILGGQTAKAIATQVDKINDFSRNGQTISSFDVRYEFSAQNGRKYQGRQRVEIQAPSTIRQGNQLDIVYVRSTPTLSFVGSKQSGARGIALVVLVGAISAAFMYLLWFAVSEIVCIWRWIRARPWARAASIEPASIEPDTSQRGPWYLWPGRVWRSSNDFCLRSFREMSPGPRATVVSIFAALTLLIVGMSAWLAGPMTTSVQLMLFSEKTSGVILKTEVIETTVRRSRGFNIDTAYSFKLPDGRQFTGQALRTGFTRLRRDEVGSAIDVYYMANNPNISGLYDQFEPNFSVLVFLGPMFFLLLLGFAIFWHGFWRYLRK